jgi:hypothetical protein
VTRSSPVSRPDPLDVLDAVHRSLVQGLGELKVVEPAGPFTQVTASVTLDGKVFEALHGGLTSFSAYGRLKKHRPGSNRQEGTQRPHALDMRCDAKSGNFSANYC